VKIIYFYQYFSTSKGSWGTRAYELSKRWVRVGHEVTVVTSVYDKSDLNPSGLIHRETIDGINIVVINLKLSNKHGIVRRGFTFLGFSLFAGIFSVFKPCDVVIASSGPLSVALGGLLSKWMRKRKFVFEVRDLFSEGLEELGLIKNSTALALIRGFEALCYRSADCTVALSASMKEWITKSYQPVRVESIPNASDCKLFDQLKSLGPPPQIRANKKTNFVYSGTLGLANNCEQILTAARKLNDWGEKDILIYLIGDGKERRNLEKMAEQENLLGLVEFLPPIPKEELATWINHCDAVLVVLKNIKVFDTVSPNKLFDAFAAGVPVIQTTQGWIRELLEDENCGATTDPQDPDSLARTIQFFAHNPKQRQAMSRNSLRLGKKYFDRDLLSQKYLGLLEELTH
jgi:glycosyltransferase involved in cell wall biosynthesis